jgi:hypothetical protein
MENQPEPTLVELIRYNNWANTKILATCQKLTADQLAASEPGTYGTIYATLSKQHGASSLASRACGPGGAGGGSRARAGHARHGVPAARSAANHRAQP